MVSGAFSERYHCAIGLSGSTPPGSVAPAAAVSSIATASAQSFFIGLSPPLDAT
ncbi:MAG TPA: hypothetical protein VFA12_05910 [Stellaceae bacterium]|nr:hypothetical protein [Stellaceae bacterium]